MRGALKGAPFRLGEADLEALPQRKIRGLDPVTGREDVYQGVDLAALEERLELTGGADTLVVHTADRRAVPIPLSRVEELRPVLAARAGGGALAERLVAWPNVERHGLTSDPRAALWWARKVVALEYVSWERVYGRALRIPEGAPAGALAGAGAFGARCMACHRIRSAGGGNGPELVSGSQAPTRERLAAILPVHPGQPAARGGPPIPQLASQLAAFLWTVAHAPPEEAEPEPEPEPAQPPPPPPAPLLPFTPPR